MHYLPSNFINSNYVYTYNNDYYVVRTNNNCYQNYNTYYCDCYNIYPNNDYLVSNSYSCSYSTSSVTFDSSVFTSNYFYRLDLYKTMIILLVILIVLYNMAFKPIQRLMGRWLKL